MTMKLSITWGLENKNMESKRLISQACLRDIFGLVGIFKFQNLENCDHRELFGKDWTSPLLNKTSNTAQS